MACSSPDREQTDPVKQQVAAHWDRRAAHFDEDFGHSIRTAAERAAWDRILDLILPAGDAPEALSNWLQIMENAMDPAHTAFLHTIISGSQFTNEFGVMPELEFVETPVGMMYIGTRRVGHNVWARIVEAILPNLQQVAPIWETGDQEHPFSGPMMSRWIGPVDDTNTMFLEFRHVCETEGVTPAWWADRAIMLPGQLAADSYEAGQRQPGDYEAQVSQRPIAIHGLEHIGATDRGGHDVPEPDETRHTGRASQSRPHRPLPRRRCGHPDILQRHRCPHTARYGSGNGPSAHAPNWAAARGWLPQQSAALLTSVVRMSA